jgi:Ala-tRNA(Pro) deacylase
MSVSVSKRIEKILKDGGFEHEILEHEPVYTSDEAARVRGVELKTGVKAMVLKTPKGGFIIGLCPGDQRLDLKTIAKLESVKKVNLAKPEDVLKITDCEIGSVPPFGHAKKLKTYMDKDVLKNEWVNFNIGEHTKSAKMRSKDLEKIVEPILM